MNFYSFAVQEYMMSWLLIKFHVKEGNNSALTYYFLFNGLFLRVVLIEFSGTLEPC